MFNTTNNQTQINTLQVETHQEKMFFAQPYSLDAQGFYFSTFDEFFEKMESATDRFGQKVEEYEFQFIDGTEEESDLFQACSVNQSNLEAFCNALDELRSHELEALFYLCNFNGYTLEDALDKIDEVQITHQTELEAATALFDEIYLADVPEAVRNYIDYDAFLNDLNANSEIHEFTFGGTTMTCTNCSSL